MNYYREIHSFTELTGESGVLRLPSFLDSDTFIWDKQRKKLVEAAKRNLKRGENVLIVGPAGTGKTALMYLILRQLADEGFNIGMLRSGVSSVGNEHKTHNFILFCDDLSRRPTSFCQSLESNNVHGVIATARLEELPQLRPQFAHFEEVFTTLPQQPKGLSKMNQSKLVDMVNTYAKKTGINLGDTQVAQVIARKSEGLPIFVWHIIREHMQTHEPITRDYVLHELPSGVQEYVDRLINRMLSDIEPRRERTILLGLLVMLAHLPEYKIHRDMFLALYAEMQAWITGRSIPTRNALMSDKVDRIATWLMKKEKYFDRLPHDIWADVLRRGESKGPMHVVIRRINTLLDEETRSKLLAGAAYRALHNIPMEGRRKQQLKTFITELGIQPRQVSFERDTAPSIIQEKEQVKKVFEEIQEQKQKAKIPKKGFKITFLGGGVTFLACLIGFTFNFEVQVFLPFIYVNRVPLGRFGYLLIFPVVLAIIQFILGGIAKRGYPATGALLFLVSLPYLLAFPLFLPSFLFGVMGSIATILKK